MVAGWGWGVGGWGDSSLLKCQPEMNPWLCPKHSAIWESHWLSDTADFPTFQMYLSSFWFWVWTSSTGCFVAMVPIIYICHVSYFLWPVEAIHLLVMDWKEPARSWMFSLCHHGPLPAAKRHSCYVNRWMWEWTVACLCVSSDWLVTCLRCTPSLSLLAQWQLNWVSGKKSMYVICYLYFKPAVYW